MAAKPPAFEIPAEMRDFAEKSVDQAKKAFGDFVDAAQQAVNSFDTQTKAAGVDTGDINRQALAYMEENVEATLTLAQRLVQARTLEEMAALQQEFMQAQARAVAEQTAGMSQTIARSATPKSKPDKG